MGLAVTVALGTLFAQSADAASKQQSKGKRQAASTALATLKVQAANVTVKAKGKKSFAAAKDGQALGQGDSIRTDVAGKAEINYTDGSLTRLAPSTEYKITRLTSKRGGRQTQGAVTVGQTWNRAAKVAETGSFEVKSGGTTAAVEGTAFVFQCSLQTATKVCQVIAVVDTVRVTTPDGAIAVLTPATTVLVTDGRPGAVTQLTYDDLSKLPFVVDNINLDFAQGKGDGLAAELPSPQPPPPPPPTTTTPPATPPTTGAGGVPVDNILPPDPPPPTPPDNLGPTITLVTPPDGAIYAQGEVVVADYSCNDSGGSGLVTCVASVANGAPIDTASLGVHSFSVAASDAAGNSAFVTHNYTVIDQTTPIVTVTTPPDGATYTQGEVVLAEFSCLDNEGGSGITTCTATLDTVVIANGEAIDTGSVGQRSFTVTGTDTAGNTTTVTTEYTVQGEGTFSIVVPAGFAVHLNNVFISACNDLSYGYEVNGVDAGTLFNKPFGCPAEGEVVTDEDHFISPFEAQVTIRIYLDDNTWGNRFYSDGSHGSVTPFEGGQWSVAITDSGFENEFPPDVPRPPEEGVGNLNLLVSFLPPATLPE